MTRAKIYNQPLKGGRLLLREIHIQQINSVCVTAAQQLTCTHINLFRTLNMHHPQYVSVSFTVGVQGVCGVMALCSEACVSGSGGESSGSEVRFSFPG